MEVLPISVIIPTKNVERTIEECLISVHRNNPAEIIVVDGNSSDRTVEIARRYTEKIYSDEGRGYSYALQLGAELATQEHIAYFDADIVLPEGTLATMLNELKEGGYTNIQAKLLPANSNTYWGRAMDWYFRFMHSRKGQGGLSAGLLRRDVVLNVKFDTQSRFYGYSEDYDFLKRLKVGGYKLGFSSAFAYYHHPANLRSIAKQWFRYGLGHSYLMRKWGPWHKGLWTPLAMVYFLARCLIKGKPQFIPYFVVIGVAGTAGMVKGFAQIIGEALGRRQRVPSEAAQRSRPAKFLLRVLREGIKPFVGRGIGRRFPWAMKIPLFFYRLFSPGITLIEVEGIKLYLDSKSDLARNLMMSGSYEKGTTRLFRDLIKEGMVILDLGANAGYYSLIAAQIVGEKGRVFAFEPAPDNFAFLVKNIEVNGFSNIIPVPKAVSNQTGKGRLFLSNDPVAHSMYEDYEKGSVEVEVTSVDEFMGNKNRPVDLVKMDVEGSEMRVLEGMVETIRRNPNLKIITEFFPYHLQKSDCSPVAFLEKLMNCGFKLYVIDEENETIELGDIGSIIEACQRRKFLNLYCDRQREKI